MSMEGNIQIESKLKAYAAERRRRLGEVPGMPPDTRRFLHVEIGRHLHRSTRHQSRERRWESFMPHLGWVAATIGVLAISAIAIWQGNRPAAKVAVSPRDDLDLMAMAPDTEPEVLEMARASRTDPTGPEATRRLGEGSDSGAVFATPPPMTEMAGVPAPSGQARSREERPESSPFRGTEAPSIPPEPDTSTGPTPTDAPHDGFALNVARSTEPPRSPPETLALATTLIDRGTARTPKDREPPRTAYAKRADDPSSRRDPAPPAKTEAASAAATRVRQRYLQTFLAAPLRRNYNSPPRPDVLNDFQLERRNGRFQIRDKDGSVYSANVGRAPEAQVRRAASGALDTFYFTAVGTNLTLNRHVAFEGRLILTNAAVPALPTAAEAGPEALHLWLNNSVMRGSATVGDRTRLNIDALPAPE